MSVAGFLGKSKVLLKLTSGKILSLNNVVFMPSMHKNLVSGALLVDAGVKIVFESGRAILSKNCDFKGKGYKSE